MSEIATAAPVAAEPSAPSVPESTESIVQAVTDDIRSDESGSTGESASPVRGATTTTPAPAAATTTVPVTQAEKDELAEMLGITADGTAKWTSRVAYSKVQKAVKALQEKAKQAHEAALKTHQDEVSTVRQQIDRFDQLVANPDALISALAQVNPAYQRFLGVKPAAAATGTPQKIETMEDLQRVIDQQVAQRLQPIEQERQARQTLETAIPKVRAQIAEAESWPLFKESKDEILATLKANPTWGLKDAYQHVAIPKLAGNRDAIRQSVLAELNTRPHSTTVTSTVSGRSTQAAEPADTESIVRDALRSIKD